MELSSSGSNNCTSDFSPLSKSGCRIGSDAVIYVVCPFEVYACGLLHSLKKLTKAERLHSHSNSSSRRAAAAEAAGREREKGKRGSTWSTGISNSHSSSGSGDSGCSLSNSSHTSSDVCGGGVSIAKSATGHAGITASSVPRRKGKERSSRGKKEAATSACGVCQQYESAGSIGSITQVCKQLLLSGRLPDAQWTRTQVLQGQMLQLGVVLLPTTDVLSAGAPTLQQWKEKYASFAISIDLFSGDAAAANKKAKASALSSQFWEAQAFPINAQENVSVSISGFSYSQPLSSSSSSSADSLHPFHQQQRQERRDELEKIRITNNSNSSCSSNFRRVSEDCSSACVAEEADCNSGTVYSALSSHNSVCLRKDSNAWLVDSLAGAEQPHRQDQTEECFCYIAEVRVPMTVNPQYLGKLLLLELLLTVTPPSPVSTLAAVDAMRESIRVPLDAWAACHGLSGVCTASLRSSLCAPTVDLLAVPFSSCLTGGRYGPHQRLQVPPPQVTETKPATTEEVTTRDWWAPPTTASLGEFDRVSQTMELLVQSLSSLAVSGQHSGSDGDSASGQQQQQLHRILCPLSVHRPLQVTTALMDFSMYVQIENTTERTSLTIENVTLRSVHSYAQGELPVTLHPRDQYSIMLRLDESFISQQALKWDNSSSSSQQQQQRESDGKSHVRGSSSSRRESRFSQAGKIVLPLCLKWRIKSRFSGPAVWSQFGAECHLPTRTPLQVTITCLSDTTCNQVLTAVLSVINNEQQEVDLVALLPRDVHYQQQAQSCQQQIRSGAAVTASTAETATAPATAAAAPQKSLNTQQDPPPLIPISSKKELGRIPPGGSQSAFVQFLATRSGLHPLPPILLLDRRNNRKIMTRGGQVVVN